MEFDFSSGKTAHFHFFLYRSHVAAKCKILAFYLLVLVKAACSPFSQPKTNPKEVMPICFILPSSITLCKGPPESPYASEAKKVDFSSFESSKNKANLLTLQVLFPSAPEMQMLFLVIWKSSKKQTKLVMVLVVTSLKTGEMAVASSVGFPHPLAGA